MNILKNLKEKLFNLLTPAETTVNYPIYMEDGSVVVCKDKTGTLIRKVSIVPEHINPDADIQLDFPRFCVTKVSCREGQIGMHLKQALVLDVDEEAREGSNYLLTSGTIYNIMTDLQCQIAELQEQVNSLIK